VGPGSPGAGSITVYVPEIGELLPVYVADRYAGFRVKAFPELDDAELEAYLAANVAAVRDVAAAMGGVEAALANHLIMGPLILARAGIPFAAKVHGSALSYTVAPHPRFLPHAREGMEAATAVLVGSRHTALSLWEVLGDPELERKTRLGTPGVDIEDFSPLPSGADRAALLGGLADSVAAAGATPTGDSFDRDPGEAATALRSYAAAGGPRVLFVGKLIVSKGTDLLLAAWPLIRAAAPGAHLLVVGFGAYREALEQLWAAIAVGDLDRACGIAARGRALEGGGEAPLPILSAFLAAPPAGWLAAAAAAGGSVSFSGRLEHAEVAVATRASDAMVVPSTFPEAFGMVAAEAAAAGVMPVCADHSGLAEVARALDAELPVPARGIPSFPLDRNAVTALAERLERWLALAGPERAAAAAALSATAGRLWSWEGVASGVLAAAAGELDALPPVPPN
jgi:glycosyltransferase involved in cell wall biosynthesis